PARPRWGWAGSVPSRTNARGRASRCADALRSGSAMATAPETIRRRLRAVPDSPGVYLFRDDGGQVIYVGKALRLRDRLRSYFTAGYAQTPRIADLLRKVFDFEFVVAANEVEALVLECNLIKHYRPRFNIRLKD